jgi:hypothetical protein
MVTRMEGCHFVESQHQRRLSAPLSFQPIRLVVCLVFILITALSDVGDAKMLYSWQLLANVHGFGLDPEQIHTEPSNDQYPTPFFLLFPAKARLSFESILGQQWHSHSGFDSTLDFQHSIGLNHHRPIQVFLSIV